MTALAKKIGPSTPGAKAAVDLHQLSRDGKVTPTRKANALKLIDRDIDQKQKLHQAATLNKQNWVEPGTMRARRVDGAIKQHEEGLTHLRELRKHVADIDID